MDATLRFILSLSIGIAVIIGIVRFRRIDSSYYPFIFVCIAALAVEIMHRILMNNGLLKAFVFLLNTYSYIDFVLFLWLFHYWGLFNRRKSTFIAIASVFFIVWIVTNIIFTSFVNKVNWYFCILYSFALIFFSVSTFNRMVVHERSSIYKNPKFWICIGIIIFYSFFILFSSTGISLFKDNHSVEFKRGLQAIMVYSNLLVNLLYAVAVIWIPRKKNFTSLF
jgi:hypothetical protein